MSVLRPLRAVTAALVPVVAGLVILAPTASAAPMASAPVATQVTPVVCGTPGYATGQFTITLDVTTTVKGGQIKVVVCGALPFETLRGAVSSNPINLGTMIADANGRAEFTIDTGLLDVGDYTVVVTGADGTMRQAPFTVTAPPGTPGGSTGGGMSPAVPGTSSGGLAFTGSNAIIPLTAIGVVLCVGGAAGIVAGRRRRDEPAI